MTDLIVVQCRSCGTLSFPEESTHVCAGLVRTFLRREFRWFFRMHFPRFSYSAEQTFWKICHWLASHGIIQLKEEGGYFGDARLAPLRYWFRKTRTASGRIHGYAPYWGWRRPNGDVVDKDFVSPRMREYAERVGGTIKVATLQVRISKEAIDASRPRKLE